MSQTCSDRRPVGAKHTPRRQHQARHAVPRDPFRFTARRAALTAAGILVAALGVAVLVWRIGRSLDPSTFPAVPPIWS